MSPNQGEPNPSKAFKTTARSATHHAHMRLTLFRIAIDGLVWVLTFTIVELFEFLAWVVRAAHAEPREGSLGLLSSTDCEGNVKYRGKAGGSQPVRRFVLVLLLPANAIAQVALRATPVPKVLQQEVQFDNGATHLVGTLFLPETGEHLPALVVFHGAAAPTRDFALYRHLEEALPATGVAVLVFDRRGSGASTGSADAPYPVLADDGIAGLHAIARNPRIDPHRIGFWGLSQGGWLALLAANRSTDAAFAISVSAPLVTPGEQMMFAVRNLLSVRGYSTADIDQAMQTREALANYFHHELSLDSAMEQLIAAEKHPWFPLEFMPPAEWLASHTDDKSYINEMDYDPLAVISDVRVPVLVIFGDADRWTPVTRSVERLRQVTRVRRNITYYVIPNANHAMQAPAQDSMAFDSTSLKAEAPTSPEYFLVLGRWLGEMHATK